MAITDVAVIDDDKQSAAVTGVLLEEVGLRPRFVSPHYDDPARLASDIASTAEAAVCDHRLQPGGFASFDGATAVAALFRRGLPAVLITQFLMDADTSIRRWRKFVPVLLTRERADGRLIAEGLERCASEIRGEFTSERRPARALVRIENVTDESNQRVADALVPQWHVQQAIRFPVDLLPEALRDAVAPGVRFFAQVNINAPGDADLYLSDFELAPAADPHDGLA